MKQQVWQVYIKDRFLGREKKENPIVVGILYLLIALLCLLLVFIMIFQLCIIDGNSMNNTLFNGEHVLLTRSHNNSKINDIVVISKTDNLGNPYNIIKRVIALPGDSIEFKTTPNNTVQLYRKLSTESSFNLIDETSYLAEPMTYHSGWVNVKPNSGSITIALGQVFVMGDNRNHSEDSRGSDSTYPISAIYGKMVLRVKRGTALETFLKFIYQENGALGVGAGAGAVAHSQCLAAF